MAARPPALAALLTDFGTDDVYVGVMKSVLLGICPSARLVDLTHAIPPQDVLLGALALADAAPYLPEGAVALAVVDPGVGSARAAAGGPGRRALLRRAGQRPAELVPGRRRRGGPARGAALPAGAGQRHLPRARRLRAGGRAPAQRRAAGRARAAGAVVAAAGAAGADPAARRRARGARDRGRPVREPDPRPAAGRAAGRGRPSRWPGGAWSGWRARTPRPAASWPRWSARSGGSSWPGRTARPRRARRREGGDSGAERDVGRAGAAVAGQGCGRRPRRRVRPRRMRPLTVPSGWPVRSATSTWVRPPKKASSIASRCSRGSVRARPTISARSRRVQSCASVVLGPARARRPARRRRRDPRGRAGAHPVDRAVVHDARAARCAARPGRAGRWPRGARPPRRRPGRPPRPRRGPARPGAPARAPARRSGRTASRARPGRRARSARPAPGRSARPRREDRARAGRPAADAAAALSRWLRSARRRPVHAMSVAITTRHLVGGSRSTVPADGAQASRAGRSGRSGRIRIFPSAGYVARARRTRYAGA